MFICGYIDEKLLNLMREEQKAKLRSMPSIRDFQNGVLHIDQGFLYTFNIDFSQPVDFQAVIRVDPQSPDPQPPIEDTRDEVKMMEISEIFPDHIQPLSQPQGLRASSSVGRETPSLGPLCSQGAEPSLKHLPRNSGDISMERTNIERQTEEYLRRSLINTERRLRELQREGSIGRVSIPRSPVSNFYSSKMNAQGKNSDKPVVSEGKVESGAEGEKISTPRAFQASLEEVGSFNKEKDPWVRGRRKTENSKWADWPNRRDSP